MRIEERGKIKSCLMKDWLRMLQKIEDHPGRVIGGQGAVGWLDGDAKFGRRQRMIMFTPT